MAIHAHSTAAPARPLLPLPALDRRAIGRDGWARARELAARLGGEIRDHVAEGMRLAWAAARGLLQAAASAPAASDASALALESASADRAFDRPAQSRSVDGVGTSDAVPSYPDHGGVVPPLLPLPAPLLPLTAALSRRRAIFGAVLAPMALASPAARAESGCQIGDLNADARLIAMAADLDRTLDGAAFAFDPVADENDQDRRLDRGNALQLKIAALPAVGLAGVLAKAKAYLDSNSYDTVNLAELADSLAEDVERVCGGLV